ncbi:MAG: sigma-54-dependent transcriptional regulator [Vicinamibacterales bacterium]
MNPARLAIVDDDQQFVGYLETLLRTRGYEVQPFTSGTDLLQALHTDSAPDVVLLDVLMPGMDGLDTLRALRLAHPGVQVIMLSGRQLPSTIVDAVRLGAADYVVKPDDPEGLGEATLEAAIRNAVEKVVLNSEVARLRAQVGEDPEGLQPYWGPGPAMRHVMNMVERIADSDISVLLRGESGVGKEVIARELHRRSPRRGKNFVKVNCAALPAELLESELFGHERGAFTGAQSARVGKFEFAHHGTIMLDEIGEMSGALQAKLLHVLQDSEFTKLGSNRPVMVDVRVIAATNRDLEQMIGDGTFREDLYYRLQVIELVVPPLRERKDEIAQLIEFFLVKYAERYGRPLNRPSEVLRQALVHHTWPGNVRELENVIKRFVILQEEALVLAELQRARRADDVRPAPMAAGPPPVSAAPPVQAVPSAPRAAEEEGAEESGGAAVATAAPEAPAAPMSLPELARMAAMRAERDAISQALDRFRWNRRKAAQALGVSYKTLLNKMKECGIAEPKG